MLYLSIVYMYKIKINLFCHEYSYFCIAHISNTLQPLNTYVLTFCHFYSDAAVTFTVPASPTAACPTIGSAAEGTKTGTVVTPAATPATGVTYTIVGTDAAQFDIDSGTGVVTIKSSATLDYETKDSYTVEIV